MELIEDQFRARDLERAAGERDARRLLVQGEAKEERAKWVRGKLEYALKPRSPKPGWETIELALRLQGVPARSAAGLRSNAPVEIKAAVTKGVLKLLESIDPSVTPDEIVNDLIKAEVTAIAEGHGRSHREYARRTE